MGTILARPTGALLVTGPTGSGKSTTLYAALAEISRPEINIITVEDPVEYRLASVNQVQINPRAGLTFANALRSILRSDPDVVMVGEIRDGETARISIEAALTGHFVLSTLHTNDAPSALDAPERDGRRAVRHRRRRLGRSCAAARAQALPALRRGVSAVPGRAARPAHRRGAGRPVRTKARLPSQERLRSLRPDGIPGPGRRLPAPRDEPRARAARVREGLARVRSPQAAREEGMRSMWEDGIGKVAAGVTSTEELARVCSV